MKGTTVPSHGIEYHERHTVSPDHPIPKRFGYPLEIPEDLLPIPPERPVIISSAHPLSKYVKIYELVVPVDPEQPVYRTIDNCIFADSTQGIVQIINLDIRDAWGVFQIQTRTSVNLLLEYDEDAIVHENIRRVQEAMRITAYYTSVIDAHRDAYLQTPDGLEAAQADQASRDREADEDNKFATGIMDGLDAAQQQKEADLAELRRKVREVETRTSTETPKEKEADAK